MNYRDALKSSKGCPKCCSDTLERFKKKTADIAYEPAAEPEKTAKTDETRTMKAKKR
jgi:hypothetical protein